MHEYFEIGNLDNSPFLDKAVHDKMFCAGSMHIHTQIKTTAVNASCGFMFGRKCAINAEKEDGDCNQLQL